MQQRHTLPAGQLVQNKLQFLLASGQELPLIVPPRFPELDPLIYFSDPVFGKLSGD